MTTYVLSEHVRNTFVGGHRMPFAQAHPRLAAAAAGVSRWASVLLAFTLAAAALSGGFLVLTGQGVSLLATWPALVLLTVAGVLYTMMLFILFGLKFS